MIAKSVFETTTNASEAHLNACAPKYCHQIEWEAFKSSDAFNCAAKCHPQGFSWKISLCKAVTFT